MTRSQFSENDGVMPHPGWRRTFRRLLVGCGLASFITVVFVVALLVTLPASAIREFVTVPSQVTGLYGTFWRGRAQLEGGNTLDWNADVRALILLRARFDLTLRGQDTQLSGTATVSPWTVEIADLAGRAGAGLLPLIPNLPVKSCNARAIIDVRRVAWQGDRAAADGRISVEGGTCIDIFDREQTIPPMDMDLSSMGADAVGVLTDRGGQLAQFTLAGNRRFIVRVEPEGAVLVPGLPVSGPIILEYPF